MLVSVDVETHGLAVHALLDVFVADVFHAAAAQAATRYNVDLTKVRGLHGFWNAFSDKKACSPVHARSVAFS